MASNEPTDGKPSDPAAMKSRSPPTKLIALGLMALALAGGFAITRLSREAASPEAAPGVSAPSASAAAAPLVVTGFEATLRPFQVTVPATGSLAANEAVAIAPELSRRVVRAHAQDGARVTKGQVLFELDGADLYAASRELAVRRKLLADSEARQKSLLSEGLASAADYERAKNELELLDAQASSLRVTIARTAVRAPFDGRLGLRQVSEGAMVSPTTTLVTLQDDSKIKVDFSLPERYAGLVAKGQTLSFYVSGNAKAFSATVSAIEPTIDATSRSLRVRGLADNEKGELVPGAFVTIELPLGSDEGALLVPSVAVIPSITGHGVWVAKEGKAALVEVTLGVRTDTEVAITKGLSPGDVVLTSGLLRLRPGMPVKLEAEAK